MMKKGANKSIYGSIVQYMVNKIMKILLIFTFKF